MTMFAQLTTMLCSRNRLDEFAELYEEHVIPLTQAQMGYRGLYLLLDRGAGKVVALTLWDSEEDAVAYERSTGHQKPLTGIATHLASVPDSAGYEVAVDA